MRRILIALAACAASGASQAAEAASGTPSGKPVPRFESLKFGEVFGREGPSFNHPILWRYQRRGLPVEVVAETADWRKVRDPDGESVWMHRRTLESRRTVMVSAPAGAALHRRPDAAAEVVAYAQEGVLFALERCDGDWRRVSGARATGWVNAEDVWGAACAD